jgi:hypothetical protein
VTVGFSHVWVGRKVLAHRYGQPCRLVKSVRGKHLIEFEDGERTITVRGTFRRLLRPLG